MQPGSSSRFQPSPSYGNPSNTADDRYKGGGEDEEDEDDGDLNRAYARQQQEFLVDSQDRILDGIAGTLGTLKSQAGVMGREILDQVG